MKLRSTRPVMAAVLAICVLVMGAIAPAHAKPASDTSVLLAAADPSATQHFVPEYGIYYDRYEPTFYTGFAPRGNDPSRLHLQLGRGNQLRATLVLSNAALEAYARDLQARYRSYKSLIDQGRLVLTQNHGFDTFEKQIKDINIDELVAAEPELSKADLRNRNLELMERLNPGRVFRITMPVDEVVRRWVAAIGLKDRKSVTTARQLELINLMLPTRLFVAELAPDVSATLKSMVKTAPVVGDLDDPAVLATTRADFLQLFERVTGGRYSLRDGALVFNEFTAVYPNGSFNEYVNYKGHQIPMFPTPGRRALTTHQRSKTVDHIPTVAVYSYSPWIPYMHVGTRLHNSFHTLWWRMDPAKVSFLPEEVRSAPTNKRTGKPYGQYWLLSRGPMSHGCTHVNTGHINELRQLLPAETERMYEVDVFLNKSHQFDVFDIDGDFVPEVMGVKYFVAYSLRNKKAHRLRAPMERKAFYDWLYGGELEYDDQGRPFFPVAKDAQFIGRKAVDGAEHRNILLYEAEYEPQKLQFYKMVDIPFARELRKVGDRRPFSR